MTLEKILDENSSPEECFSRLTEISPTNPKEYIDERIKNGYKLGAVVSAFLGGSIIGTNYFYSLITNSGDHPEILEKIANIGFSFMLLGCGAIAIATGLRTAVVAHDTIVSYLTRKKMKQEEPIEHQPYELDGKFTEKPTVVEETFGKRIYLRDSSEMAKVDGEYFILVGPGKRLHFKRYTKTHETPSVMLSDGFIKPKKEYIIVRQERERLSLNIKGKRVYIDYSTPSERKCERKFKGVLLMRGTWYNTTSLEETYSLDYLNQNGDTKSPLLTEHRNNFVKGKEKHNKLGDITNDLLYETPI